MGKLHVTIRITVVAIQLLSCVSYANYSNPVLGGDWPDPGVVKFDGLWYAATTGGDGKGHYFGVHTSPDLATWTFSGFLFDSVTWPKWADTTCWAPEIHLIPSTGRFVVFFVSKLASSNTLVIGAALSSTASPLGPYVDRGTPLVLPPPGACFGVIDPTFYFDSVSSTAYVVYKEDGNSCGKPTNIYAVALSSDGLNMTGSPEFIISNTDAWENGVTEAPWIMLNASTGSLFLFYSGSSYNQPSYAIGVARSESGNIAGPWSKYARNPVMHSAPGAGRKGSTLHYGPGHCSVVAAGTSGGWAFLYAAEQPGGAARNLMLDAVKWTPDGWPGGEYNDEPSVGPKPVPQ